jgi:hypothetical protein
MAKARNYRREYDEYQGTPEQIKNRAKRNSARAKMVKAGRASKGDGKDVDHKIPLSKGGSAGKSNLRVVDKHKNRAFKRRSDHKPA